MHTRLFVCLLLLSTTAFAANPPATEWPTQPCPDAVEHEQKARAALQRLRRLCLPHDDGTFTCGVRSLYGFLSGPRLQLFSPKKKHWDFRIDVDDNDVHADNWVDATLPAGFAWAYGNAPDDVFCMQKQVTRVLLARVRVLPKRRTCYADDDVPVHGPAAPGALSARFLRIIRVYDADPRGRRREGPHWVLGGCHQVARSEAACRPPDN